MQRVFSFNSFDRTGNIIRTCFAAVLSLAFSDSSHANWVTTRLRCDVEVVNTFSSGRTERIREKIQVDVRTSGGRVVIEGDGNEAAFVIGNVKIKSTLMVEDVSQPDFYGINAKFQFDDLGVVDTRIKLDRVTGRIDYQWLPDRGKEMKKRVMGECKKIEAEARQF